MSKGGQYQVVISSDVASVYKPLSEMCEISTEGGAKEDKNGKKFLERLVDTLSGIFTPILPAITAAGMIKAVLALFSAFHWLDKSVILPGVKLYGGCRLLFPADPPGEFGGKEDSDATLIWR